MALLRTYIRFKFKIVTNQRSSPRTYILLILIWPTLSCTNCMTLIHKNMWVKIALNNVTCNHQLKANGVKIIITYAFGRWKQAVTRDAPVDALLLWAGGSQASPLVDTDRDSSLVFIVQSFIDTQNACKNFNIDFHNPFCLHTST